MVEFLTAAQFPATGNSSLLYIATDAGRAYRWVGTAYAEIGPTSFATVTPPTASASTLGGVRIGSGVSIDNSGVISVSTAYAAATHSHAIADVTGLQSALDGKAAVSHTHGAAGITDFGAAADARIAASDKVSSNATGIAGADQITNIVSLTQAEYDAIGTKNAATLYVIAGG